MTKKKTEKEMVKESTTKQETKAKSATKQKSKPVIGRKKKEDKLKLEIETLSQELAEAKDKYLRLYAEFDNFKRRSTKEKLELMSTAAESTILDLLPVLDDFDRAESSGEVATEGIQMVKSKLFSTLKSKGLTAMESNHVDFDPELHEAITEIPSPTPELKNKIVDTIEKGYYLNDKIIRFAKVVVGK